MKLWDRTGGVTRKQPFRDLVGAAGDEMVVGLLMCGYRREGAPAIRAPRKLRPLTESADGMSDKQGEEEQEDTPVLCFRP